MLTASPRGYLKHVTPLIECYLVINWSGRKGLQSSHENNKVESSHSHYRLVAECQKAFKNDFSQPSSENKIFALRVVYEANVRYFE